MCVDQNETRKVHKFILSKFCVMIYKGPSDSLRVCVES